MHALLPVALLLLNAAPLSTLSEQSVWKKTGRYDEVLRLCEAFPKAYPGKVRCERFGVTPEGRPMVALAASADGALDPAAARKRRRPVVLFQGGIHAGEIDGKDAGFWLLRDMLDGKALPGVLSRVTAVFVPVFNVDGHERFGPNNRPNQVGPEEMGWRYTAQDLNLNRDYAKAETPEMVAMLRLLGQWDPIVYLDLHVTDGAEFQPDMAVLMMPVEGAPPAMRSVEEALRAAVKQELETEGHTPLMDFYPDFIDREAPSSGFARGIAPPRFSTTYWTLRNRFAVLLEMHSWKDYATRVKGTRDVVLAYLGQAAKEGTKWLEAASAADEEDRQAKSADVVLAYGNTDKSQPLAFPGYAYVIEKSEVSGKSWIRYDETKPQTWQVPYFGELKPVVTAQAPAGGYIVPAAHAEWVRKKLETHGFTFQVLPKPLPGVEVEAFRATEFKLADRVNEGRVRATLKGAWAKERRDLPAGSLYVPAAQRGRGLLVHLLDPAGPDSFVQWGFFDAAFQPKESGMEDYVLELEARKMLARDPGLKAEFEKQLATDAAFAKDPAARLRFFAQRHPTWDERLNLYPILRVQAAPAR